MIRFIFKSSTDGYYSLVSSRDQQMGRGNEEYIFMIRIFIFSIKTSIYGILK
jgi:hypothetical protein